MKMFPVILSCVLVLGLGQVGNAADQGCDKQAAVENAAPAAVETATGAKIQPRDANGNPMTDEEFAKAEKARMEARIEATQNRLEQRQSRWKKHGSTGAAAK